MSKYILIYRSDPSSMMSMSDEEKQAMMGEWKEWFEKLKTEDSLVDTGAPLMPMSKVVFQDKIEDGPVKSGDNSIINYYIIIKAENLGEAVEIAKGSPTTKDGSIEVREMINMPF